MQEATCETEEFTASDQRTLILDMFMDGDDPENFIALIEHTGIDLAAAGGDVRRVPDVILGHYRVKKGFYDIECVANDLARFPPVSAGCRLHRGTGGTDRGERAMLAKIIGYMDEKQSSADRQHAIHPHS